MLSYIMGLIQKYRAMHQHTPNVVVLNEKHFHQLCNEIPGIIDGSSKLGMGLHIHILSEESCAHPDVYSTLPYHLS